MRKLVTIRNIANIFPIIDADIIERAQIDGWNVVVKKGDFQSGDSCIYAEIDSVFPATDERFAFLEGKRLKTKKMRGVVSQGIAFPISILGATNVAVGDDVTDLLGVTKYEPPAPKDVSVKGDFPWFISKTDAERVQNLVEELQIHQHRTAYITEKLDGSSITIFCRKFENEWQTGVCSRNFELKLDAENQFVSTVKRLGILEKLVEFCQLNNLSLALQGELVGAGVQGNKYKFAATDIFFFNVFDIAENKKLPLAGFVETVRELGFRIIPILQTDYVLHSDIERYLSEAEGKSTLNDKTEREGIIFRTLEGDFDFKAISNRFLLKND